MSDTTRTRYGDLKDGAFFIARGVGEDSNRLFKKQVVDDLQGGIEFTRDGRRTEAFRLFPNSLYGRRFEDGDEVIEVDLSPR